MGSGLWVWGVGLRVWGLGLRVWGSGLRVQGLGFWPWITHSPASYCSPSLFFFFLSFKREVVVQRLQCSWFGRSRGSPSALATGCGAKTRVCPQQDAACCHARPSMGPSRSIASDATFRAKPLRSSLSEAQGFGFGA